MEKIKEEIAEIEEAVDSREREHIEEEVGDLLFAVVNLARKLKINPEDAIENTNKKFESRFRYIESKIDIKNATLKEMERYWEEAKNEIG